MRTIWGIGPASEDEQPAEKEEQCGRVVTKGVFIPTGPGKGYYPESRCQKKVGHPGRC